MIESSTYLLTEIHSEMSDQPSLILGEILGEEIKIKSDYIVRSTLINCYYYRLSWANKLSFLSRIIDNIRSIGSLSLLVNTFYSTSSKIAQYEKTAIEIDFVYDKILQDHNRMLNDDTIEKTLDSDVEWFETLPDAEQVSLTIGLLRISGGALLRKIYSLISKRYKKRLTTIGKAESTKLLEEISSVEERLENHEKEDSFLPIDLHDPNSPYTAECKIRQKKWRDTIDKYRTQIEMTEKRFAKRKESSKKKKVSAKKTKGKSKKAATKSKDDSQKAKRIENEYDPNNDYIQIIPIGIAKKILGYVDDKTLKRAKKVNDFWKYVITDLFEDRKIRKELDKTIKKFAEGLDLSYVEIESKPTKSDQTKRRGATEERIRAFEERGTILEKLRHTNEPLVEECVLLKAYEDKKDEYRFNLHDYKMFPRVVQKCREQFPYPRYIVKDLNLICDYGSNYIIQPTCDDETEDNYSRNSDSGDSGSKQSN